MLQHWLHLLVYHKIFGMFASVDSFTSSLSTLVISVSINPGATAFIFMFLDANSLAEAFVNPLHLLLMHNN